MSPLSPAKLSANKPCPCHSGRKAKSCCGPILKSFNAETVEALMRSRYAAYAVRNAGYIIATTHPSSPLKDPRPERWLEQICNFCDNTDFPHLTVHSSSQTETEGHVHFTAGLIAGGEDRSFTERSVFYKVDGRWLYHSATSLEDPL